MKVDLFISELERRLDRIENYGNLKLDATINRAYSTLDAVRESCSHVSGELIGVGRRRARILVETVESRYNDALPTRETLEAKAQAGMRLMEGFLNELETRALAVCDSGFSEIIDGGWRIAEEGYGKAKGKAKEVVDEVGVPQPKSSMFVHILNRESMSRRGLLPSLYVTTSSVVVKR